MTRTPDDATVESPIPLGHVTVLARKDCPWTFSSEKDGEAAHQLMDHNQEEHS